MNATTYQNDVPQNIRIDKPQFQKMIFIMNALEQGWVVKKAQESYIFTKKHENRREIFQENYLEKFVEGNTQFPSDFSYRKWAHYGGWLWNISPTRSIPIFYIMLRIMM